MLYIRPKQKRSLVSGNQLDEKLLFTRENKTKTRRQKVKESKGENLTGYGDIVCEFAL